MFSGTKDAHGQLGPEVLVTLSRRAPRSLRVQLEDALRDAIRTGALAAGAAMPPTRTLASDLGVSRRLVVEAYEQLVAEGYLAATARRGTMVARTGREPSARRLLPAAPAPAHDLRPGTPDLAGFPRSAWQRAMGHAIRTAPDDALRYPDPAGAPALREALAAYLRRVRGVVAAADRIVICAGFTQGLALLTRALRTADAVIVAVEDPGLPGRDAVIAAAGGRCRSIPVDADGIRTDALAGSRIDALVVTPAHQFPTGVPLMPERRAGLIDWADSGRLVIEDDYDAEFRYDRAPLAALQGLAPEQVAYVGSVSKTLAPGLRLGWLVLPARLVGPVAEAKRLDDAGAPIFEQLAFADLLERGHYDRHLRQARRRYRARRDAMVRALASHVPGLRVTGAAAGLHLLATVPPGTDMPRLSAAAAKRRLAISPIGDYHLRPPPNPCELVIGYANLSEPAIPVAARLLGEAVDAARSACHARHS